MRIGNLFSSLSATFILASTPIACSGSDEASATCTRHADCASDVCDTRDGARGVCLDEAAVVHVDNAGGPACESGDGTRARPLCTVAEALARLDGARRAIRLAASTESYGQLRLGDAHFAVYGPDDGGQALFTSEEDVTTIWIDGASDVTLDGITVQSLGGGVRCESAPGEGRLTLRRSAVLHADGRSLRASGCEITVDRTLLAGSTQGVELLDGARYRITNTIIAGQGFIPGRDWTSLYFSDDSAGTFSFNTVAGNLGLVECGATSRPLTDSIFINPDVLTDPSVLSPSQLSGRCELERVVVGTEDATTSPGAIPLDPDFVDPSAGDYHLTPSAANRDCCIDQAARRPDVPTDHDGDRRPLGAGHDIGADEVE